MLLLKKHSELSFKILYSYVNVIVKNILEQLCDKSVPIFLFRHRF